MTYIIKDDLGEMVIDFYGPESHRRPVVPSPPPRVGTCRGTSKGWGPRYTSYWANPHPCGNDAMKGSDYCRAHQKNGPYLAVCRRCGNRLRGGWRRAFCGGCELKGKSRARAFYDQLDHPNVMQWALNGKLTGYR